MHNVFTVYLSATQSHKNMWGTKLSQHCHHAMFFELEVRCGSSHEFECLVSNILTLQLVFLSFFQEVSFPFVEQTGLSEVCYARPL